MDTLEKIFFAILFSGFNIYAAKAIINKSKIKATIFVVLGVGFLSLQTYMTFSYYNSIIVINLNHNSLISSTIEKFENKLRENNISKNDREKLSVFLARYKYENKGVISNYFGDDGAQKIFVPSEENINNLKKEHEIQYVFETGKKSLKNAIILWLGSLILSLLVAATMLIKNAHNQTIKRTENASD